MLLNPYLTFDGTCREAFNFYRSVFGGSFASLQTFAEAPAGMSIPADRIHEIMHVSLPIGGSILMGCDNPFGTGVAAGSNFSISVNPDTRDQCEMLFGGLSAGGEVLMPLQETFWGAYYGMCRDRFGIAWMFNYELRSA
jgi:PhnB protein